ncbi:hypothetical protein HWV62_27494 [Athelia sp. TMB]|nr:hypothetical protein HWV62_33677 [Athelia sp. TMB]KAF7969367.1 hypothetical protein HWV62_27494 [Athelia sp. TMB]
MLFCPTCANLLIISSETGYNKWACNSCPYEFPISKQVRFCFYQRHILMKRKEVDDVLGGDEMWKHADMTAGAPPIFSLTVPCKLTPRATASCDKCNHGNAYFFQLQIRSADEPMTTCEHL